MDKQKQGIGAYKDRPGYFLGGMVGGAILGALVNKIQGKDWKRGAIFGGLTGGLGAHFLKPGGIGSSWASGMDKGLMKSMLGAATKNTVAAGAAGALLGGGASYMAGDPEDERKKQEEAMARREAEQRRKNEEQYPGWYGDPWADFNRGGRVHANQGGLEQIETQTASAPNPMAEAFNMFVNEFGRPPSSEDELMEFIQQLDIDRPMAARGGRIHAKDGLWANIHAKRNRIADGSGEKMRSPGSSGAPTAKALRDSKSQGGISDLDMRLGGASNGPGTGTSDDIPAMLSDGEFVVTANAVKNLGGGDRMVGAQKMYQMMNQLDPNSQTPAEMTTVGHG
jgi:hypothetical protein